MRRDQLEIIEKKYQKLGQRFLLRLNPIQLKKDDDWTYDLREIQNIERKFRDSDVFRNGCTIDIPIHEKDSPRLTGEYIRYESGHMHDEYYYYDQEVEEIVGIPITVLNQSKIGLFVRFWSDEYSFSTEELEDNKPIQKNEPSK